MKTFRAMSILWGAAILVVGASAGPASAGPMYGGDSCCDGAAYGYISRPDLGSGGCGFGNVGYFQCGCRAEYARYIVGHGPMYPAGENSNGYSYGAQITPKTPTTPPAPNGR
jgi:hypothetical protein